MNKIITISREFGSGGREVGRCLAEELGIAYYDQEIVTALISRTEQAEPYIRYMEKERPLPLLPITTARTFGLSANYVLRDMRPVRLFIYAASAYKIARCRAKGTDLEGLSDAELRKQILAVDKKRSRYYQFYTSRVWGRKENYDLCVNTSRYDEIKKNHSGTNRLDCGLMLSLV